MRATCGVMSARTPRRRPDSGSIAALDVEVRIALEHDGAKAIPFRLEQEALRWRQVGRELGQHRLDRRRDGKALGRLVRRCIGSRVRRSPGGWFTGSHEYLG